MAIATLTETDIRTRDAVARQLEWDPEVDAAAIGVTSQGGVVTLTGFIDTYSGKLAAERAAKRVLGVRGVANDIEVRLKLERTDTDIARDAVRGLELRSTLPDAVQVAVHHGWITLTGSVGWLYQQRDAEKAVRHIRGVRGIHNHINVAHGPIARDIQRRIVTALHRDADLNGSRIDVTVAGNLATLTGSVTGWSQRDAAERTAASAPGITRVDNQLHVDSPELLDEIC